jgi:Cu/Ag efflux protein CusF
MMNRFLSLCILTMSLGFVFPAPLVAQSDQGHMSHGAKTMTMTGEGVVKRLSNTSVTLKHGPIGATMPPMTMEFAVADAALLRDLKKGDEVTFTITSDMLIIEISAKK